MCDFWPFFVIFSQFLCIFVVFRVTRIAPVDSIAHVSSFQSRLRSLYVWGVDSVKSTVTVLEEGNFTEEGGGFDWRGCFSFGGYHFLWRRSAF